MKRILIVGTGSIGQRHAANFKTLGVHVETLSLRETGVDGACDILRKAEFDGAVIATQTQIRLPLIEAAADGMLPLYIEKPLACGPEDVAKIYAALEGIIHRSLAGFMMRYHPLLPHVAEAVQNADIYRFDAQIGHDVLQWRQNWSFAQSYAARADGGGVLLDLCHELDLVHVLFPQAEMRSVMSLGHKDFAGVDMASQIALSGSGVTGMVAMDYLAGVFHREMRLRGQNALIEADFLNATMRVHRPDGTEVTTLDFERNQMFMDAAQDFLDLIEDKPPRSGVAHVPTVPTARASCDLIAHAWANRQFSGTIEKDVT